MLRLLGLEENLKTIAVLSTPFVDDAQPVTFATIKRAYQRFLANNQPHVPSGAGQDPLYVGEGEVSERLLSIFNAESSLSDTPYQLNATGGDDTEGVQRAQTALSRAREQADALAAVDPVFGSLYRLAVNYVFYAPCGMAGGGTTSAAIGVLWVDPRPFWGTRDLQEFLIHELGHTLLFLDEWRFGLFTSYPELLKRENWVASAIRKTVRPLDKAFHSVVVATEVLLARDSLLGHPSTSVLHPSSPVLASGVLRSIQSMTEDPAARRLLTDHALDLLDRCQGTVSDLARQAEWTKLLNATDEVTARASG